VAHCHQLVTGVITGHTSAISLGLHPSPIQSSITAHNGWLRSLNAFGRRAF
jgi:hypothetical protein